MANRNATFAKRQRETELKDRAKAKEDRRNQKRSEVRTDAKGPQIAWDEAVTAVTTDENAATDHLPSLEVSNRDAQRRPLGDDDDRGGYRGGYRGAPRPMGPGAMLPPLTSNPSPAPTQNAGPGEPAAARSQPVSPPRPTTAPTKPR